MSSDFPNDIKDAINWWAEANLAHIKADAEYNKAKTERYLEIKCAEEYKYELNNITECKAYLECYELVKKVDKLEIEALRRITWVNYLVHQGSINNVK